MSGICAFFGHRDTPLTQELENKLEESVLDLISTGINEFWVCNEGNFDWLSRIVMTRLKKQYSSQIYVCFMKNHPANAGGISVPSKLRLPIRLKVGLEFAFHWLTPVVCAFDVISAYNPDKFSTLKRQSLEQKYELDYPAEIADKPPKFAILERNKYIADRADVIICFIKEKTGGAYRAVKRAQKNGKKIINLADIQI